ncbi:hypothetical protein C8R44DRAFT_883332 [Mycena epipterygia]|nr:hypothetical protein C8R44DRAFT_883332 [Mycena epipterygia]
MLPKRSVYDNHWAPALFWHCADYAKVRRSPLLPCLMCASISQLVLYVLNGSDSVNSMYDVSSTAFAVPDGNVPVSSNILVLTDDGMKDDSMAALLRMSDMVSGRFTITAVVHHTSRGDNPAKFVITNVPWGPNRDKRIWAAPTPGASQKHLLQLEQANGDALQQWEFTLV